MQKKRAVIITWSGFQDQEVIYPYYRLLEEEFTVDFATDLVTGVDNTQDRNIVGLFGTKFKASIGIVDLKIVDYDLLVLPGGVKALEKLRQDKKALEFIRNYSCRDGVIASICHGAQLLISANIVKGRVISGYYSIKDDIINAGGIYLDSPYIVDSNIISSPHYKHMGPWMKEVLRVYYINGL
jgi:protease I